MPKAIRAVITYEYTYVPDLDDLEYSEQNITTIEAALELDKKDFTTGKAAMIDMVSTGPKVTSEWRVVDE